MLPSPPPTQNLRNGEVEFVRFIMAVIIVIHHTQKNCDTGSYLFIVGSLAVEFFFLLSGYLMVQSIQKLSASESNMSPVEETWGFLLRKVKSFLPEVVIAGLVALLMMLCLLHIAGKEKIILAVGGVFNDVFLFRSFYLKDWAGVNGPVWYLSSMLICMSLLFPLFRKFGSAPWILTLSLLIIGLLIHETGCVRGPSNWFVFTLKGNLRAFAEIGIGAFAYYACSALKNCRWTVLGRWLLFWVKWLILIGLLTFMGVGAWKLSEGIFVALMWLYLVLVFTRGSVDGYFYDKKLFYFLGKLSLPLYLIHFSIIKIYNTYFPAEWSALEKNATVLLMSLCAAPLVMYLAALWRKYEAVIRSLIVVPK